jgi:hypothetical protein
VLKLSRGGRFLYAGRTFRRLGEPSGSANSDLFAAIPLQP